MAERSNYVAFDSPSRRGADRGGASPTASHEQAQPSTKVNTTACTPVSSQRAVFLTRWRCVCVAQCLDVNPQRTHIAAGCSDNNVYIYDVFPSPSAAAAKTRHRSRRVGTLSGHTKPVDGVQFGHMQTDEIGQLLSSSEDETVRIWGLTSHAGIVRHHSLACIDLRPAVVRPVAAGGGGARSRGGRAAPTRRSDVSCIIWSLDDTRVITSAKQALPAEATPAQRTASPDINLLQVWSAVKNGAGTRLFTLGEGGEGHRSEDAVHVLKAHPYDRRLMLSGGYDGRVFLWNLATGEPLVRLMDVEGTKVIEGSFSQDGTQVVVADTQGYFSVLGSGPPPTCLKEQFFARDYDPLRYDQAGWCEDATTQEVCYSTPAMLP